MSILYSVLAVVVVLAIVLPLFYVYIISKARERLEREVIFGVREDINALVREFNKLSLSNIGMLESLTLRSEEILREIEQKEAKLKIKRTTSATVNMTNSDTNSLEKKSNSRLSYNQEIEARKDSSYVSRVDNDIEKELVISNQENTIFDMHNLGYSPAEIALKINRPTGEVELILSMNSRIRDEHEEYEHE